MLDPRDKEEIRKLSDFLSRQAYSRRVGDTPNDRLQLAPMKYVNLYGSVAGRPASVAATIGQQYFATDLSYPIYFGTNNAWVNGAGSIVAFN